MHFLQTSSGLDVALLVELHVRHVVTRARVAACASTGRLLRPGKLTVQHVSHSLRRLTVSLGERRDSLLLARKSKRTSTTTIITHNSNSNTSNNNNID